MRLVYLFTGEFFSIIVFTFIMLLIQTIVILYYMYYFIKFHLTTRSFLLVCKVEKFGVENLIPPNLYKFLGVLKKIALTIIYKAPIILLIDTFVLERVTFSGLLTGLSMYLLLLSI